MYKLKKQTYHCWAAILIAAVLSFAIAPTALADTDASTPKLTQQPDQLVLQLGTRWAGVEFELRTDAGVFPAPVVVDETGVLRMDLGGSTTYTLSCIESSIPIPDPQPVPEPDTTQPQPPEASPAPQPAPAQQGAFNWPVVVLLMVLTAIGGGLIAMQIFRYRQQMDYDEWEEDEGE